MRNTKLAFSEKALSLKKGLYKHYKGNLYKLVDIGRHSETLEEVVVYQDMSNNHDTWVRPLNMFVEKVKLHDGQMVPRFAYQQSVEE